MLLLAAARCISAQKQAWYTQHSGWMSWRVVLQVKVPPQRVAVPPMCIMGWYSDGDFVSCMKYKQNQICIEAQIPQEHIMPDEVCPENAWNCVNTATGPGNHRGTCDETALSLLISYSCRPTP
jgi:hypothetical protein